MALTVDLSVASEVQNDDQFTITLDDDIVYGGANASQVD